MARAIDVEKAIEIIEEKQKELCPVGRYGRNYVYGSDREKYDAWEEIIDALDNLPTLTPPNEWVSVEDRLPESTECWKTYIVTVNRSHWPTSSYDLCDAPYNEELVAVAQYDSKQKIWHLSWDEQLNALIQADDAPLNGDFVTHWMPLPEPSGKEG